MGPPEKEESAERTRAYLRMVLAPGLSLRSCHRILDRVDDPRSLPTLGQRELVGLGVDAAVAADLLSPAVDRRVDEEWDRAKGLGAAVVDIRDPRYPPLLLETYDPPLVLYIRGRAWDPARPHVAVVGARRASGYGINCAERFAADLAARGAVIASGLARGVDTAAHGGALSRGRTVAVLGTGIDRVYPPENAKLADAIIANGAILSEFPLGAPPLPDHFPRRNRILAGMTLGTVVVEAAQRSGSLITARMAMEANREVFAVPGPVFSAGSYGPHLLIRQGACLAARSDDIVDELPEPVRRELSPVRDAGSEEALSPTGKRLRGLLSASEAMPIDILIVRLGAPASDAYAALLELELAGLIRAVPGDRYMLKG